MTTTIDPPTTGGGPEPTPPRRPTPRRRLGGRRLRLSWIALVLVVLAGLVVGASGDTGPRTTEERVEALASTIRCPTCRSQAAGDSDAASARAVVVEIREQIEAGASDAEVRDYFRRTQGEEILLTPSGSGVVGLVWVLPVVVFVIGAGVLVLAFRRWRRWSV